jgi:hypothetical protein
MSTEAPTKELRINFTTRAFGSDEESKAAYTWFKSQMRDEHEIAIWRAEDFAAPPERRWVLIVFSEVDEHFDHYLQFLPEEDNSVYEVSEALLDMCVKRRIRHHLSRVLGPSVLGRSAV